jgi:lysine biosynthesis protein LysW
MKRRLRNKMTINCTDCGGVLDIPSNAVVKEVIECPDCGLEYVVEETDDGLLRLVELNIKGEDWGE